MHRSNVVLFPVAKSVPEGRTSSSLSRASPESNRSFLWPRRILRHLITSATQQVLFVVIIAVFVAAWLGRLMFGFLSLGFLGKLWLHWGKSSAWVPAMEFGGSLLIFCLLSALLAWVKQAAPPTPAPVVRLSLWDRLLLVSRR